ncbi:hypothetical protein Cs7R123_32320 [Catellatospora sp. TT07R-123]|uniref:phosphotransferase n=1 Tax=Catellatospora sp. TT07R-123 TaxID=2733863 RepID=UPI001B12DC50|nr:phosphotransferase [Catellatospora sp. TT07R-123]GHJ45890.1 hypothetical protein Cs7R123_32320 [Catellatospora sp. TT07R-123]
MTAGDEQLPHGQTAQRLLWQDLSDDLKLAIEDQLGGRVLHARSQNGGFTQGMASVLYTRDHGAAFVKAVPASSHLAEWCRREAAVNAALPTGLPVPGFRWSTELAGHVILCFDPVSGELPQQSWEPAELLAALAALAAIASALTVPPPALAQLATTTFSREIAESHTCWQRIDAGDLPMPPIPAWAVERIGQLAQLEALLPLVSASATGMIHYDLRPDNVIIARGSGQAAVCDWARLDHGPVWVDTINLLISAAPYGHDVDALLAAHPSAQEMPDLAVEAQLASWSGYLLVAGSQPPVPSSPHFNTSRYQCGLAALGWLRKRLEYGPRTA